MPVTPKYSNKKNNGLRKAHWFCFLLIVFTGFSKSSIAQQVKQLDSLFNLLTEVQNDSIEVDLLNSIAYSEMRSIMYVDARKFADEALQLAREIGYRKGEADANFVIGFIMWYLHRYSEALQFHLLALAVYEELNDDIGIMKTHNRLGHDYADLLEWEKSMEHFETALRMAQMLKSYDDISRNLDLIGFVYMRTGDFKKAYDYYLQSLQVDEEQGAYSNMAGTYNDLSELYTLQTEFERALEFAKKGFILAESEKDIPHMLESEEALEKAYVGLNNYKEAFNTRLRIDKLLDTINSDKSVEQISLMQMQYAFEKKEMELKAEQEIKDVESAATLHANKKQRNYFIAGFIVIFILFSIILLGYNQKQRANNIMRKQKLEVEQQRDDALKHRLRAEQSEKFKEQFLANMSHEIRTPMNAVSGMTDLLIKMKHYKEQEKYLFGIQQSSETLLHIINDILDLSKVESGKLELEEVSFSLSDVVNQVLQLLRLKAEEKGLKFTSKIEAGVPDILLGDPHRLKQILINLCGNAIKFTEKGFVKLIIALDEKSAIRFCVKDSGIGIPEDKIDSIFESFKQVHASDTRKFGGTGLGLTISKQLIELQGGHMEVQSKPGSGTSFYFTIPFKSGVKESLLRPIENYTVDASGLNGLKILLADDNELNRMLAIDTLLSETYVQIDTAENGKQVLQLLNKKDYDVILMDVQMPEMDGYEATRQIRQTFPPPKNAIPIIALTASVLKSDIEMCIAAGMNNYVPKPFKAWQLYTALAKATHRNIIQANESIQPEIISEEPVTNLAFLNEFTNANLLQLEKYIKMYLDNTPDTISDLNKAMEESDMESVKGILHKIKPQLIFMGMERTGVLAAKVESDITAKEFENINERLSRIIQDCNTSILELKNVISV